MTESEVHRGLCWLLLALAAITLPALFFIVAPYGRHASRSRLPTIHATLGWVVMESPSALVPLACFLIGNHRDDPARLALLVLWELHYVYRAYVFPFRRRGGETKMPISILFSALTFTSLNGYLNGRWLFTLAPDSAYGRAWLSDPRFVVGVALFLIGYLVKQHADQTLFNLRKPGETGYKIPRGGLYRWVSCPNYLGEIIEWVGFAIASWSLPGACFAVFTVANLLPRAVAHHAWYRGKFPDYPKERRALIPWLL
jgi:steroid 5-alpha-reductase/3-oxo-5-alpha-steroid 4-dehydrogenase 1